jgi:hypothetical protein
VMPFLPASGDVNRMVTLKAVRWKRNDSQLPEI